MSTGHSGGTFGSSSSTRANHLATETSPYLLQHAYNPVNWYPWCDEAFERAVKENKPVFLSIGYSTWYGIRWCCLNGCIAYILYVVCWHNGGGGGDEYGDDDDDTVIYSHWCHVMEHESFEDRDVADLLNNNFVSIKVDREERPDIGMRSLYKQLICRSHIHDSMPVDNGERWLAIICVSKSKHTTAVLCGHIYTQEYVVCVVPMSRDRVYVWTTRYDGPVTTYRWIIQGWSWQGHG